MNWDANLAAIIKHTDANLQQHFRQFEELGAFAQPSSDCASAAAAFGGRTAAAQQQQQQADTGSFANAFLRDTMATLRGDSGMSAATPTASFAQHFRAQQDRKNHGNNHRAAATSDDGASDYDDQQPQHPAARSHRRTRRSGSGSNNVGLGYQMYTSPTYDMAQMMEQVRLSLKLEVDARAAIAERQLSALLQLCKSSSEELDRLRVEVCAADRQLHTLDQVQAKMRQELTTQKDIGFHLQSLCGKDESWRMQAENQLLEMRQLVAAIREQGNGVQMQVQDKLSRQELLVQFNAAIEPIKAQFQATLQHQAHQLAEITRASSSSSLVLDALTQKLNRVQADEIVALRNDLQALKIHVSRMGAMDSNRGMGEYGEYDDDEDEECRRPGRRSTQRSREREAAITRERERLDMEREQQQKQRDDAFKKELVEETVPLAIIPLIKSEIDRIVLPQVAHVKEWASNEVASVKHDLQSLTRVVQENWTACQRQSSATASSWEAAIKQADQQMRAELATQLRELQNKQDQLTSQSVVQVTSLVDSRVAVIHSNHSNVTKAIESEQKDRKAAHDALLEELRRVRHSWEEQIHVLGCEQRSKAATLGDEWSQRLRELERKWSEMLETAAKQHTLQIESACATVRTSVDARLERLEGSTKASSETLDKVEKAMATLTSEAALLAAKIKSVEALEKEEEQLTTVRRGSIMATAMPAALPNETTQCQLASIDSLLQKMMLQMQLQMQQQQQLVMAQSSAVPPSLYAPSYWPTMGHAHGTAHSIGSAMTASPATIVSPAAAVPPCESVVIEPRQETRAVVPTSGSTPNTETAPAMVEAKPAKPVELLPDPRIDEIISRAVAEELASPGKSHAPQQASPTPDTSKSSDASSLILASSPATAQPQTISATSSSPDQFVETKAPQTLALTVKGGATTEAEMAKQRIEARRKQEQEARQQVSAPPPPLARASSTSLLATESAKSVDTKAVPPPLPRSHSVNNLAPPTPSLPPTPPSPAPKPPTTSATTAANVPPPPPFPVPTSSVTTPAAPRPPAIVSETKAVPQAPGPSVESKPSTPKPPLTLNVSQSSQPPQPPVMHVLCDQCRLPVRSDLLADHMQRQCIKRTVACTKCTVKFPWHEVDPHQRMCQGGSASTSPSLQSTGQSAPIAIANATPADPATLKKCRHCAADISSTELMDHELKCDQILKQCPHCLRRQKVAELQDHIENCDCRLVGCPNDCGGKFLQRGLDKHLTTRCPKRSATGASTTTTAVAPAATPSPANTSVSSAGPAVAPPPPPPPLASRPPTPQTAPPSTSALTKPDDSKAAKVECKFCDEEFAAKEIDAHENSCDWKPRRCQHCNMVIISRDLARHEASCKTSTKNCPHCNDTMALSALAAHTSRCSKRPIKCIRCCQLFPADAIVAHSSSCKFIPSSSLSASTTNTSSAATPAVPSSGGAAAVKIPPPPPYPPTAATANNGTNSTSRAAINAPTGPPSLAAKPLPQSAAEEENASDRVARRNLALSQLTNQSIAVAGASRPTNLQTPVLSRPEVDEEDDHAVDDDEEEEDEEDEDEDDEDQLTLAQVVAEWSVENVCLWLHEDVGVPEVVPRFQQRRCNGEMLLELTESDLINDYAIRNRVHRERILSAIDAIKTSDDFSDEEEDEEEGGEEEEDDDEAEALAHAMRMQTPQQRASMSRLTLSDASTPLDLLRRNSMPSPQQSPHRMAGAPLTSSAALPSSSAMLRRINSALSVEFPSAPPR